MQGLHETNPNMTWSVNAPASVSQLHHLCVLPLLLLAQQLYLCILLRHRELKGLCLCFHQQHFSLQARCQAVAVRQPTLQLPYLRQTQTFILLPLTSLHVALAITVHTFRTRLLADPCS